MHAVDVIATESGLFLAKLQSLSNRFLPEMHLISVRPFWIEWAENALVNNFVKPDLISFGCLLVSWVDDARKSIVAKPGLISDGFFLFDWVNTALISTVAKPELMQVGFFWSSGVETASASFTRQFSGFVGLETDMGSAQRKVFFFFCKGSTGLHCLYHLKVTWALRRSNFVHMA
jgi:hypothetical protein